MTTQLRINPFIVTLGTMGIVRGIALIISNGLPVHQIPAAFAYLGEGNLLGVPFVLWILLFCALTVHVVLEHTRLGRYAFAIGSNTEAAVYSGVAVNFHTAAVYTISGALTGLAGMIEASRFSVVGTLVGAFIMGLLSNGSDLLGISPYLQQAIIGAVIILAVAADELRKRKLT
jgi:ribose/xylose/arabinose/galactoside ABC-type transport system permease subunit